MIKAIGDFESMIGVCRVGDFLNPKNTNSPFKSPIGHLITNGDFPFKFSYETFAFKVNIKWFQHRG